MPVDQSNSLEHAIRAAEDPHARLRLYEAVLSTTTDFAYIFDLTGRFLYANRRLLEVWGRIEKDAIGKNLYELGYPQWHADMHMRELAQVIRTKQPIRGEVPFTGGSGISGVYEYIFTPVLGRDGQVEIVAGTTRDVTERKHAQERANAILESVSDAFFSVDRDWRFTYVNKKAEQVLERQPGDLLGKSLWEAYPGLLGSDFEHVYRRAAEQRVAASITAYYPDHDRWYDVNVYPAQEGSVSFYFRDVSERRREEDARQQLLAKVEQQAKVFDTALSNINDFAYTFDLNGRFLYVNKPLLNLWGLPLEQAVGKNFYDLKYEPQLASKLQREIQQVIDTRRTLISETEYVNPAGERGYFEYIFSPVLGPDGSVELVAGSTRVITQRKQLELELENQRSRLSAIIEQAPAFMCTLRGPEHVYELANNRYYQIVGQRELIGRKVRDALPEVEGQGFFELLDRVFQTGESFEGNEMPVLLHRQPDAPLEERFVNLVYQAMRNPDGTIHGVFTHGVDVTDLVRSRNAVRDSELQFRQLADAMPQIVWAAKADGTLDYYNRRWFEYIGQPENGGDAVRWDRFIHPDDLSRAYTAWAEAIQNARTYVIEFRVRSAGGDYRWFLVRALPIRDESGVVLRWFGTCTDIQEQKELQAQRESLLESERAARSDAERASRMKDEFLATLSHELRTPLNAILGWATILADGKLDETELREGLDTIRRNAHAQTQIIEDLLDMSRIVNGKVRLDVQAVDLAAVVRAATETVRPAADAKGIRLKAVLDPTAGPVSGDPNRLQQVLWNLLSNAIKFTRRGGQVQVLLERVNSQIEVHVIDTGDGIKPEFLPHVFDRFRQADASTTRRHGGLGLGLAIVRQLVELHGGTVRVKSPGIGQGSTFTISLPLTIIHPEPAAQPQRRHPRSPARSDAKSDQCVSIEGVRVLVVDDEPDARALVKRLLEDCDAKVTTAASADEAITRLHEGRFDVLVSDVGMPGRDGYDLIKTIRNLPGHHGSTISAIALTAYARGEDRVKSIVAGFDLHLSKPVDPSELIAMVASLATRRRNENNA